MIIFIHPALRNYRLELFNKLNQEYDIKFIFQGEIIKIPDDFDYEIIRTSKSFFRWVSFIWILIISRYNLVIVGPDFTHLLPVFIICKLRSKKIIFWGEDWYWSNKNIYRKIKNNLFKLLLTRVDSVLASGVKSYNFYMNIISNFKNIYDIGNYVIPYKIRDITRIKKILIKKDLNIKNKKIIIYLSRIIEKKGLNYLLKSFKMLEVKLPTAYLLIGGRGNFEKNCKKLAKQLNIKNIMFLGYIKEEEMELYYNLCNVLVLPSIFYNDFPEAIGYVLLEAMSVGKPVIATTAVGAAPEYVRDGVNGFVVEEKNIEELYNALYKLLINEDLEREMGIKSKEIFLQKCDFNNQYQNFKNVIEYTMCN